MTYPRWPKCSRMVVTEVEDEERVHEEEKRSPGRRWTDFVAERTVSHWHLAPQQTGTTTTTTTHCSRPLLAAGRWRTLRHGPGQPEGTIKPYL